MSKLAGHQIVLFCDKTNTLLLLDLACANTQSTGRRGILKILLDYKAYAAVKIA